MQTLANYLVECDCDSNYPIVPSYTYNSGNLDTRISMTDEKYHKQMIATTIWTPQLPATGTPTPSVTFS